MNIKKIIFAVLLVMILAIGAISGQLVDGNPPATCPPSICPPAPAASR